MFRHVFISRCVENLKTGYPQDKANCGTTLVLISPPPLHTITREAREGDEGLGECTWTNAYGQVGSVPNAYFHIPLDRRLQVRDVVKS